MYYTKLDNRKWIFYTTHENKKYYLYQIRTTRIVRHTLIKNWRNPFDPEFEEYMKNRISKLSKSSVWSRKATKVAKKSNFICKVCEKELLPTQELDIHHVLPKKLGGTDKLTNLLLLHRECHKQVTHTKNVE